jgi:hypothetical protein
VRVIGPKSPPYPANEIAVNFARHGAERAQRQRCGASAQQPQKLRLSTAGLAKAVFVCMILSRLSNIALPSCLRSPRVSREEGIPINSLHGS